MDKHTNAKNIDSEFRLKSSRYVKMFESIPGQEGDFEHRIFYGYDIFAGYLHTQKEVGFVCPSVIVNVDEDGRHEDSGKRLLMILRTRCIKPVYHALIYSHVTGTFQLYDNGNFFVCKSTNFYTAWHVPFDFDNIIKG